MKRKICIVTGHRGEYGIFTSILEAIKRRPELEYSLIVTGLHLSPEYGHTIDQIKKDGYRIDETVDMLVNSDTGASMAKSLGLGILGITQALERINPDIILILGDRIEPLAGAIAGAHMNIPVAHLHGGEVSGSIDESIRHAITKFSHIHLPATRKSYERILKLGEEPRNVFLVGAVGLDLIRRGKFLSKPALAKRFGFDKERPIVLAVQHPVTTEIDSARENMDRIMRALIELKIQTVYLYSNPDAGNKTMMRLMYEKLYESRLDYIKVFKNLPRPVYLSVMRHAEVMIGNSSSGIIEAPSFGIPVVNIGTRQQGRERAKNIIDVPYKKEAILKAIKKALIDKGFIKECKKCDNPYDPFGDGRGGERAAKILAKIKITQELIQKKIVY